MFKILKTKKGANQSLPPNIFYLPPDDKRHFKDKGIDLLIQYKLQKFVTSSF